ncbi:hypothetical protein CISG_08458 [Coccidioides immitis RMSCC 3703]|uniref:Uncharacterized protein n=1 Tax=Coccidioides immitis RMSCC 3703 TaxID=454286 RepID=A0A0J8R5N3_COCIT|nr:hypothetical protein CISG_08458 [Coccidioides immitis RMSCC 3703]
MWFNGVYPHSECVLCDSQALSGSSNFARDRSYQDGGLTLGGIQLACQLHAVNVPDNRCTQKQGSSERAWQAERRLRAFRGTVTEVETEWGTIFRSLGGISRKAGAAIQRKGNIRGYRRYSGFVRRIRTRVVRSSLRSFPSIADAPGGTGTHGPSDKIPDLPLARVRMSSYQWFEIVFRYGVFNDEKIGVEIMSGITQMYAVPWGLPVEIGKEHAYLY